MLSYFGTCFMVLIGDMKGLNVALFRMEVGGLVIQCCAVDSCCPDQAKQCVCFGAGVWVCPGGSSGDKTKFSRPIDLHGLQRVNPMTQVRSAVCDCHCDH